MWPSAEDRHVHRCGGCCCCCVSCGLLGPVQKETVAPTSRFKTVLASVGEGEVKLQLLTSGRKKKTPAAATGIADGRAQERSSITECVALT